MDPLGSHQSDLPLPEAVLDAAVADYVGPNTQNLQRSSGRLQTGLWLRWERLVYEVDVPRVAKEAPTSKRILHQLSGQVLPGQLLAVMGPSGSGKTSLIKLLAGRRAATDGVILVNGEPLDAPTYRRSSGFVAQTTVFLDTLTVRETITITALLRLDRSMSVADKRTRAEEVLEAVDLRKVGDSQIGNDLTGGISGGERRRLSIGIEVVHKPRMILLDEPTSGLDATSAQMVGDTLRRMSNTDGTSSLCTIHQPRASLLAVFDSLLLLAEGYTVYFGPIGLDASVSGGVLSYFSSHGYTCPPLENPADWLIDLVHRSDGGADGGDVEKGATALRVAAAQAFAARYSASALAADAMALPLLPPPALPKVGAALARFPTSWFTQFRILWKRTMIYKLREPSAIMTQASTAVVMPLLIGGIYWQIPLSQAGISDRLAGISFTVLLQAFMCIDQILLFPKERAVYLRDHAVGLHSTSSFFAARSLAEMPFILLFGSICGVITHLMFGFNSEPRSFLLFIVIMAVVTEAGAALLTCVGAISPTMEVGNLLATLFGACACVVCRVCRAHCFAAVVLLTLLDGFYRNLDSIPLWIRWLSNLSFMGWGVQAAAANEFRGLQFSCTPEEAQVGCILTGDAYLQRLGMGRVNIARNIGIMIALAAGWRFIGATSSGDTVPSLRLPLSRRSRSRASHAPHAKPTWACASYTQGRRSGKDWRSLDTQKRLSPAHFVTRSPAPAAPASPPRAPRRYN